MTAPRRAPLAIGAEFVLIDGGRAVARGRAGQVAQEWRRQLFGDPAARFQVVGFTGCGSLTPDGIKFLADRESRAAELEGV